MAKEHAPPERSLEARAPTPEAEPPPRRLPGRRTLLDAPAPPEREAAAPVRVPGRRTRVGAGTTELSAALLGATAPIAIETGAATSGRAHALGGKIFVRAAELDLARFEDRLLVGHELAHVIQQRRGAGMAPTELDPARRAALEAEADAAALAFAHGRAFAVTGAAPAGAALFQDARPQIVHMTLLRDVMVLELSDGSRLSVACSYHGAPAPGTYAYDTATRSIAGAGATPNAAGNIIELDLPSGIKLDGLPHIPLEVSGGDVGGARARRRIQAEPALDVAMPGTKVRYFVGTDPEIGGDFQYRWFCYHDPASTKYALIPPVIRGPTEPSWEATWGTPGGHLVVCEVTSKGRSERYSFFQRVKTEKQIAEDALAAAKEPDYLTLRARLAIESLELRDGGIPDQGRDDGPYIECFGANPAVPNLAPDLAWNTYMIVPSPAAKKFRWYVRPPTTERMAENFHGHHRIIVDGAPAYDLDSAGRRAGFVIAERGRYTIVCDEIDEHGARLGTRATYVQVVESLERSTQRGRWDAYVQRADAAIGRIAAGKEVGLRAVYVNRETGQQVSMQLFAGPDANDPKQVVLVDLLPGVDRHEYRGGTIDEAIDSLERGNAYPTGTIKIAVPPNAAGLPTRTRTLAAKGESDFAAWAARTGWASLGLTAAGVVAAAIPGGQPVAGMFFLAAAGTGVASGSLSLYDRLQKAERSPVGIALDIAGIAASMVGAATTIRALRVGAALTFTGASGRFLFYAGFVTNAVSGLLVSVDGIAAIVKVLDDPAMARGDKIAAIVKIVASLILQAALFALSIREVKKLRDRISKFVGKELGEQLAIEVLHSLNLLDDAALAALKGVPAARLQAVAELARLSPVLANRLVLVVGGAHANHELAAAGGMVDFNGQISIHPAKLARLGDEDLRGVLRASRALAEAKGDLSKLAKADLDLVNGLKQSMAKGAPRPRLRFEAHLAQADEYLQRIGATKDPRGAALFANPTDADRTRVFDLVNSQRPSGATQALDQQASDWALSRKPATVSDYVNYVEMYLHQFKDRIATERAAYGAALQRRIDAGASKAVASKALAKETFGAEIEGMGKEFDRALGAKVQRDFGLPGDETRAGAGAAAASTVYDANARALDGKTGPHAFGPGLSDPDLVARLRAQPELWFSSESAGAYHVEKHINDLPPAERTGATAADRVNDYLASAAKTVREGVPTFDATQTGTRTVSFVRTIPGPEPRTMKVIVTVSDTGNVTLATYMKQ